MVTTESEEAAVRVTITAAGRENLLFRALLRQTIPLLRHADRYSETQRTTLLQSVCRALNEDSDDADEPDCPEDPWT